AGADARLCQEPAALVRGQPSGGRRGADDRCSGGLQQVEHLADSQTVPVAPRRTGGAEPEALTPWIRLQRHRAIPSLGIPRASTVYPAAARALRRWCEAAT